MCFVLIDLAMLIGEKLLAHSRAGIAFEIGGFPAIEYREMLCSGKHSTILVEGGLASEYFH